MGLNKDHLIEGFIHSIQYRYCHTQKIHSIQFTKIEYCMYIEQSLEYDNFRINRTNEFENGIRL